jgi:hypothetical protein
VLTPWSRPWRPGASRLWSTASMFPFLRRRPNTMVMRRDSFTPLIVDMRY